MGCGGSRTTSASMPIPRTDITELRPSSADAIQGTQSEHCVHSASTILLENLTTNTNLNNNKEVQNEGTAPPHTDDESEVKAATKIQAHYRGYIVRKENKQKEDSDTDSVFYKSTNDNPGLVENNGAINREQLTISEMPPKSLGEIQNVPPLDSQEVVANEGVVQEKQDGVTDEIPSKENDSQPAQVCDQSHTEQLQNEVVPQHQEDNNSMQPQEDAPNHSQEEIPPDSKEPHLQMETTNSVAHGSGASDSMEPPTPNSSLATGLNNNPESSPMESTENSPVTDNSCSGGEKEKGDSDNGATEEADKEQDESVNTGGDSSETATQGGSDQVQSQEHIYTQENNEE